MFSSKGRESEKGREEGREGGREREEEEARGEGKRKWVDKDREKRTKTEKWKTGEVFFSCNQ